MELVEFSREMNLVKETTHPLLVLLLGHLSILHHLHLTLDHLHGRLASHGHAASVVLHAAHISAHVAAVCVAAIIGAGHGHAHKGSESDELKRFRFQEDEKLVP